MEWTFSEWVHNIHTYERDLEIHSDRKHVSNRFGFLLLFTTGRGSTGHVFVFDIGYLGLEIKTSATWFFRQFIGAVKHSSKVVFTNASADSIASIRSILPASFIMLDEWHLNLWQYNNFIKYLRPKGESTRFCKMERKLHSLRLSSFTMQYKVRRAQLSRSGTKEA